MTRVLIADDQALVRAGFRMILEEQEDLEVVGEAEDGDEAVALAAELLPDIVLMDVRMPVLDGLEATRRILVAGSAAHVLVLTTFDTEEVVYEALKAGAGGFLLKSAPPARLIDAVRLVAAGEALLAPTITRRLIEEYVRRPARGGPVPREIDSLTEREREVLLLIARGLSNAEIAAALFLSAATVKTHVNHVLQKLALRDRVQAVVLAYEYGLVQPGDAADAE